MFVVIRFQLCVVTQRKILKFCWSARLLNPLKVTEFLTPCEPEPESPYAILYIYSLKSKETPHRTDTRADGRCNLTLHEIHHVALNVTFYQRINIFSLAFQII